MESTPVVAAVLPYSCVLCVEDTCDCFNGMVSLDRCCCVACCCCCEPDNPVRLSPAVVLSVAVVEVVVVAVVVVVLRCCCPEDVVLLLLLLLARRRVWEGCIMIKKTMDGTSSSAPYCHHHDTCLGGATTFLAKPTVLPPKTKTHKTLHNNNLNANPI